MQSAAVAQWIEQARPKGKITGSSPVSGANWGSKMRSIARFCRRQVLTPAEAADFTQSGWRE